MNQNLSIILASLIPITTSLLFLNYALKLKKSREKRRWLLQILSKDLDKIKNGSQKYLESEGRAKLEKSDFSLPYWKIVQNYPEIKKFKKDPMFKEMFSTFRYWEKISYGL